MAKKLPPKYPHRGRQLRRRLMGQAFLLVCAAGVITFHFYIKVSEPDEGGTLMRLGESIGMAQKAAALSNAASSGGQRAAPPVEPVGADAPAPSPTVTGTPPLDAPARVPERTSPGSLQEASAAKMPPEPEKNGSETEPQTSGKASSPGDTADLPFPGLSLAEVGLRLASSYAGEPPGAWGERVPGVVSRLDVPKNNAGTEENTSPLVLALTFDACGGGKDGYDGQLIDFLRERKIPATLFITSLWMRKYPERLRELAVDPLFEIAAHGERHRPCSIDGKSVYGITGTASIPELVREVFGNARELKEAVGLAPRWFRSGAAFYDEAAVKVIHDLGMGVAGYSIAGDQGATLSAAGVAAQTLKARHGDILLFHMNKPRSGTREGLMRALPQLLEKGAVFVRLSDAF